MKNAPAPPPPSRTTATATMIISIFFDFFGASAAVSFSSAIGTPLSSVVRRGRGLGGGGRRGRLRRGLRLGGGRRLAGVQLAVRAGCGRQQRCLLRCELRQ